MNAFCRRMSSAIVASKVTSQSRSAIAVSCVLVAIAGVNPAHADQQTNEHITLPPFTDTYYWREFVLTKAAPLSDDGRYRLVKVRSDGNVEVIDCAVSDVATKIVVVKPAPKKFKKGEPLPTLVVVNADPEKQQARLKELRIK